MCAISRTKEKKKKRIKEGGPWIYDKSMMVFEDLKGVSKIEELEFRYASIWVHFHNLPMVCFTRKLARILGDIIGEFERTDIEEESRKTEKTLSVKGKMDILQPLARGAMLKIGSKAEESWSRATYEKLPDYCYSCGRIGHVLKDCNEVELGEEDELQYGPWLREDNFTFGKTKGTKGEGGKTMKTKVDKQMRVRSTTEPASSDEGDESSDEERDSRGSLSAVEPLRTAVEQPDGEGERKKEPLKKDDLAQNSRNVSDKSKESCKVDSENSKNVAHNRQIAEISKFKAEKSGKRGWNKRR